MLKHIRLIPLAAESLGVRSMCTYVQTPDVKILLDAGVSLCPRRFGLPPHPSEFRAIDFCRRRIASFAEEAEVVTLSHYHFDHHTPSYEDWLCNWTKENETAREIYQGKIVLAKNAREKINHSQRRRGWMFRKTGGKFAEKILTADGKTFYFGDFTRIRFSQPVFHGAKNSFLGWVLMTTIEYQDEKFLFTSDVQGPMCSDTLDLILREKPEIIMVGGPPLYLAGFKVKEENIRKGLENLERIVENVPCTILEHHILRDKDWRKKTENVFEKSHNHGHKVLTAAEFLEKKNHFLESTRKHLFIQNPSSKAFKRWMRKSQWNKKHAKPPI